MNKKILVIKHVPQEGPGLIGDFFRKDGWDLAVVESGGGEKLPGSPDQYAALVVLGGPMNVYETDLHPFLLEEERLMRKALISEVPVLGVCLGAQLLAKTCGARVKKAGRREIGWYTTAITDFGVTDTLFQGLASPLRVFQWHEDTFDIPAGGFLLVRGRICRNQAFRIGRNAYGLQFHLEVTPSMIEEWMKGEGGAPDTVKILRDGEKFHAVFAEQAARFLANFRDLIESSLRTREIMKFL